MRSPRTALVVTLAAALLLGACAAQPTPYQPIAESGGYEETQLGERVFRVSFRGNRYTPETDVLDYLFLRSAELTQRQGYTHFLVQEDFGRTQLIQQAGTRGSVGFGTGVGGRGGSFWGLGIGTTLGGSDTETAISYHLAVFVIRLLSAEEVAAQTVPTYEARFLMDSVRAKKRIGVPSAR
jgi:hypothetical protein